MLQSIIASGDLDLNKLGPNQVNMPETWVPIDIRKHIKLANPAVVED